MTTWIEPTAYREALPKTIKYCKTCQAETPHQIRSGSGLVAKASPEGDVAFTNALPSA